MKSSQRIGIEPSESFEAPAMALSSFDAWLGSPYDVQRYRFPEAPVMSLNAPLDTEPCKAECVYGTCRKTMSDPYGCGGCCACLGGCHAEYEKTYAAPYLWEGDDS